jgi:hypothetical protein
VFVGVSVDVTVGVEVVVFVGVFVDVIVGVGVGVMDPKHSIHPAYGLDTVAISSIGELPIAVYV